jgi:amidohydrolase
MGVLRQRIEQYCRIYHSEVIAIRRHIHANPELAFQEHKTADFISRKLKEYGIPHETGIAKTGIVGFIEGKKKDKIIALRADMDALPITEENDVVYKSKVPGVMHACGHDAHVAMLLGAAKILNEMRRDLDGSVRLIFQPSEEVFPGGAKAMIEAGVLENVRHVIGQHVQPTMRSGTAGFKTGQYMASTDEIYLTVKGKGGHAALPQQNVDSVLIAAHIIVALQQIVSRMAKPDIPTVLSFGRFMAEGQTNVIPDEVHIAGTIRTFNEEWRAEAHKRITKLATELAQSMGGNCDVRIAPGYPFVVNDKNLTENLSLFAREYLGKRHVQELDIRMTAEDFAYYSQVVPSTFFRIGTRIRGKEVLSLHTSKFDIDEDALYKGMGLMAYLAYRQLEEMAD